MVEVFSKTHRMRFFIAENQVFFVGLVAAAAVWTIHLASASGDMAFCLSAYAGSLILQGAKSLFAIQRANITAA